MKATFEVEYDNLSELRSMIQQVSAVQNSEGFYRCCSRLRLIGDTRKLFRQCQEEMREPSLTELRDVVFQHVIPV